ncbi:MAG: hypothetical protein H6767_05475 [Candidatus Peribacteria bacterium]|nr:MAG: hypothetical protein H6767_05475 [Candidatus Peribacteria bacterium]
MIEGDFIQRNLESTGGKITSELRGMIEFNLQKLVQEKREEMLSSFDIKGR